MEHFMSAALQADLKIVNKLGLHARAAARFVKKAMVYSSDIFLIKDGEQINAKSIMGILLLAAEQHSTITLMVSGEDQVKAFAVLKEFIQSGFGE